MKGASHATAVRDPVVWELATLHAVEGNSQLTVSAHITDEVYVMTRLWHITDLPSWTDLTILYHLAGAGPATALSRDLGMHSSCVGLTRAPSSVT